MLRIIIRCGLVFTLAAFVLPTTLDTAEAGRKYKSRHGMSHSGQSHHRHRRGTFYLSIPKSYWNGGYAGNGYERKYYRGGPKIINVQKELRRQRKRRLSD